MVRKMPRIGNTSRKIAVAASVVAAVAIVAIGYLLVGASFALDDFFILAIAIGLCPIAVIDFLNANWQKSIDEHLPDLFRSIVQAQQTGMTLSAALEDASKRNYGPLSKELKKMTIQMSWGLSFEDAFLAFGKRTGTKLTQRVIPLIIEASKSGGNLEKVFDPMGKFIQSTITIEKERKAQTRPYIAIIYIAVFVFVFTIGLLFKTFFTGTNGDSLFMIQIMPLDVLEQTFLRLTVVQGLFGGLVAGKMGEGSVSAGLKHSLVLMVVGYIALKLLL
jgi:flagellar protein FlaJ